TTLRKRIDEKQQEITTQLADTYYLLKPNGLDDSENFKNALMNYKRIILNEGIYHINVDVTVSNATIIGNNVEIKSFDTGGVPLTINGDNNIIEGLEITSTGRKVLEVNGNNNKVLKNKYHVVKELSRSNVTYLPVVSIVGSYNKILDNEMFNGGSGITIDGVENGGTNNIVKRNSIHDNTMGIRNAPSANHTIISENNVYDNNVVRGSGADGIIVHRNSTGVIVENNHISNSGEHGVYAQGDHLII